MSNAKKQAPAAKTQDAGSALMVRLTVTLFAICAVCALLLGLVNAATAQRIKDVQDEKNAAARAAVLPAGSPETEQVAYTGTDSTILEAYKAGDAAYVFRVAPAGSFGGGLEIMVGVSKDGSNYTVSGVEIVQSNETSGLGANAKKPAFREQFVGKSGEVKVTKDGGEIDALTGATITSRAVSAGVTSALAAAATLD